MNHFDRKSGFIVLDTHKVFAIGFRESGLLCEDNEDFIDRLQASS